MLESAFLDLAEGNLVGVCLFVSFSSVVSGFKMTFTCFPSLSASSKFPRNIFITHNQLDHAGELPMLFVEESKRRYLAGEPRLRVLSGPEVEDKLKTHRLDEMLSLCKPVSEISCACAQSKWSQEFWFRSLGTRLTF